MPDRLEATESGHALPLAGKQVTQLQFDYRVGLLFEGGALVAIGGSFRLVDGDSDVSVDPERPETVAPALRLLRATATRAEAETGGALTIDFADGLRLYVPPDDHYEPWEAVGPGPGTQAWRLVSMPGGDLAVWY